MGLVYLITAGVFLGLLQVAMKVVLNGGTSPYALLIVTSLTAAVCASFLGAYHRFRIRWRNEWRSYLLIGFSVSGITLILEILGLSLTSVQNAGVIMATSVIFTALFSRVVVNERLTRAYYVALPVALIGAWLISTGGTSIVPQLGDLFILSAAIIYGFVNAYIKRTLSHVTSWEITVTRLWFGVPIVVIGALLFSEQLVFHAVDVWGGVFVGGAGFIAIFLVHRAIDADGPSKFSLFAMLALVVALSGGLFLGERLSALQGVGALLVLATLFFLAKQKVRQRNL